MMKHQELKEAFEIKEKIFAGFIWIAWGVGILYLCVQCCSDMI
tara:strand:- start:840 stop:968 length:129 start_codon:yes stop_codon:yes gene_type:complete